MFYVVVIFAMFCLTIISIIALILGRTLTDKIETKDIKHSLNIGNKKEQ